MLHAVRGAIAVFVAKATKSFTRLRIKVSERIFGVRISLYFVLCVPVGLCLCQQENTWDNNCWGGEIKELILLPSFIFGLQHMRQGVPVTRQLLISCIEKRNPGIDNRKTTTTKKKQTAIKVSWTWTELLSHAFGYMTNEWHQCYGWGGWSYFAVTQTKRRLLSVLLSAQSESLLKAGN